MSEDDRLRPKKTVNASKITISQLMQPSDANPRGNVHGGLIMKLVDEAGALACMRHAQHPVVTVAVDQMMFRQPIRIGDLVILTAEVTYVGRTSMEARVQVVAENPVTGKRVYTNTAYMVYVALDADGKAVEVPELILESDIQKEQMKRGRKRQEYRLAHLKELEDHSELG